MEIGRLHKAINIVRTEPVALSAQAVTYLRTYRSLLDAVEVLPRDPERLLSQVAVLAYGWMPRVARLDPKKFGAASDALVAAAKNPGSARDVMLVTRISECVHSVVGTSKVLHFVRPDVYPIWDSKVARVWSERVLSQAEISAPQNYIDYANEVHELASFPEIDDFLEEFGNAYSERLKRLGIAEYKMSPIRTIEVAAFELSGGEYEDA